MPKDRPTIVSFYVDRPAEHPEAAGRNYFGMLEILQRSCDQPHLRHLVLTDTETANSPLWPDTVQPWSTSLPGPLMQACTEAQARYLESKPEGDTLFVGADCIFLNDPLTFYPKGTDMCVTYRDSKSRYPINTGAQMIRRQGMEPATALFRRIANRCGTKWCDDQLSLIAELSPMPPAPGKFQRAGMVVSFLPMKWFNVLPRAVSDPCKGTCMLHFRGKARKQFFFDWATANGFA